MIEWPGEECLAGGGTRGPAVATVDAERGWADESRERGRIRLLLLFFGTCEAGNDGIEHDEAGKEARVHQRDVCEGVCAKGVAHGDEGARGPDGVDEVGDVAGVVEPGGWFFYVRWILYIRCEREKNTCTYGHCLGWRR